MRAERFRAPMAEINVTPMVDVTLVLLIIFMVAAPLLQQGIVVELPKAAATREQAPGSDIVLTLTREHVVYVNGAVVTLKELRERLAGPAGDRLVLIRADRHAAVYRLVELWDLCREAGFSKVQIMTLNE